MASPVERRIHRNALICLLLGIGAIFGPALIPDRGSGFSGVAEAILWLLALLVVGLLYSLYPAVMTWQNADGITARTRLIGFSPLVLYALALIWLFWFLGY